jgi:hypothetical protein
LGEEVVYEGLLVLVHSGRTDGDEASDDTLKGNGLYLTEDMFLGRKDN